MTEETDLELQKLIKLLAAGSSAPLTVKAAAEQLAAAGFEELRFSDTWGLSHGGKYFMVHHGTSLFAFTVGQRLQYRDGFRIAAAHTDYPCLRVKPNPDMKKAGYGQLNVEVYGSPLLHTWLDRPLGVSGRVAVAGQQVMKPEMHLIDIKRPLMVIPNLAIHMNREANNGVEWNRQTDLLPIINTKPGKRGLCGGPADGTGFCGREQEADGLQADFLAFLAKELSVKQEDILDYELWLTCLEEPKLAGIYNDFLVSPRLDDLTSVQALLSGIIEGNRERGFNLIALFDHEEVGSRGKQGAASTMLSCVMEKMLECFGRTGRQQKEAMYESMLLSVDVAHGVHPNHMGKADPTNQPVLNGGLCLKESSIQSYATDCEAVAVAEQLCRKAGIAYQKFVNRSDIKGGGTLGGIASALVPVPTVDVGVPILAMHSAVETMGARDQASLAALLTAFFSA